MWYRNSLKISIIFIYVIIIAGAVVRMTGSGMGCPDWPQCFGYLVPPTEEGELQWKPNHAYEDGQVIILEESLRVAPSDFISSDTYNEGNWTTYDKHDYASFNVWHTWIEYINRLASVLAGFPMLLMVIMAFWYWKNKKLLILMSFMILPFMLFQAWLGKQVVDSNLLPIKITIHMIATLVILGVLLFLWFKSQQKEGFHEESKRSYMYDLRFRNLMIIASLLTLVQIGMGTQVRQYIDERVAQVGYDAKGLWLDPATIWFYVHRSFSILITFLNVYIFWRNRSLLLGHTKSLNWVLIFIGLEVFTGIVMYYVDFPFGTQPLHLVVSSLLFGIQFYILLESFRKRGELSPAI